MTDLPDSVLAPELVGVILVEDYSAPLTDIERGCRGSDAVAAVAAEFGIIVLVRVGSPARYDLVATEAHFSTQADAIVTVGVPTAGVAGLTASDQTTFEDQELPGRPTSQLGLDTQVAVPANRTLYQLTVLSNTMYRIPLSQRLGTVGLGDDLSSLMIASGTANIILRGGFTWTERPPLG